MGDGKHRALFGRHVLRKIRHPLGHLEARFPATWCPAGVGVLGEAFLLREIPVDLALPLTEVGLPQPGILDDGQAELSCNDLSGGPRPPQVGRVHRGDGQLRKPFGGSVGAG